MSNDNQSNVINIAGDNRCPKFSYSLGRVNVILGSNGTGKSTLMNHMQGAIGEWAQRHGIRKISPVHGNRVLYATSQSARTRNEAANPENYITNLFRDENYDHGNLQRSADSLLEALCQDHTKCGEEHSDACTDWHVKGKNGEMPMRRESNLARFSRLFNQIFPEIKLIFDPQKVSVRCEQKGATYDPNNLSTGEKQIFLLLGRFISNSEPECFLIDEPDRNLNPKLAERFWETLEDWHHKDSVFVYTTHLPSFALRSNVDRVFLLDGDVANEIDGGQGFLNLDSDQRAEFLGTVPSIVIRSKVLIVEGEDGGIDAEFYRYLLGDDSIEIVPVKDCHRVRNAVCGAEPWDRITSGIQMAGIVDRDFRSDDQIKQFEIDNILPLKVHEVESFLCLPELITELLRKKYADENRPDIETLRKLMKEIATTNVYSTAYRRTSEHIKGHLSVSTLTSGEAVKLKRIDDWHVALTSKRADLLSYLNGMDPVRIFDEERARLERSLADDDWPQILALFEGKRLAKPICGLLKVDDVGHLLKEIIHHCPELTSFPTLAEFRRSILDMFVPAREALPTTAD